MQRLKRIGSSSEERNAKTSREQKSIEPSPVGNSSNLPLLEEVDGQQKLVDEKLLPNSVKGAPEAIKPAIRRKQNKQVCQAPSVFPNLSVR